MRKRSLTALWLACLATLVLVPASRAQSRDIAVVVNPNNPVTNVSVSDVRKLFTGEKRNWPGGVPVRLILRIPGSREHEALLRLLGLGEGEYKQYWAAQMFRGEAESGSVTAPSLGIAKEAAIALPGAVTLVDVQDLKPGMKVIRVNGRLPGEPGYPLH
jgi:hypothetical protein